MKDTIVKKLLEVTKRNLDKISPIVCYNINEEYFLIKEQEEKDEFAIGFAEWLSDWHTKERLKEILKSYKKEKGL